MYFHNFVIISPWKKVGPFIWTNLSPHHQRMHYAKFGRNWSSGSWEDFLISPMYFRYFVIISPRKKAGPLHLNKLEFPSPKDVTGLVEIGSVVLEKKIFLISSMYFHYFIIISGWNWLCGSGEEDENVKRLQTDRRTDRWTDRQTTDDRWSEKLTWAFSSGELKTINGISSGQNTKINTRDLQETRGPWTTSLTWENSSNH